MNIIYKKKYTENEFKDAPQSLVKTGLRKVNAADKLYAMTAFAEWVKNDFALKFLNQRMYKILSYCFRLSSCYKVDSFWLNYVSTVERQLKFVNQLRNTKGLLESMADLESNIVFWLNQNRILEQLQDKQKADALNAEYKEYLRLKAKFENVVDAQNETEVQSETKIKEEMCNLQK